MIFQIILLINTPSWNAVYEQVTKNAVLGLWARRSKLNLVGAHINVFTGEWTQKVTLFEHHGSTSGLVTLCCCSSI